MDQSSSKSAAPVSSPIKSPAVAPPLPSSEDVKKLELVEKTLQDLREEYDFYKKEQAENVKLMREENRTLSDQLAEHRVMNAKLKSRLEYNDERFTIAQSNTEQYRRQVAAVEDKYKLMSATAAKYEEANAVLREVSVVLRTRQEVNLGTDRHWIASVWSKIIARGRTGTHS